jgi:nitrite reductase/ring-hydroxylating ferredoxin subunit
VDGAEVSCPWHNWTFDVASGENTTDPAMRVSRHAVKVEDGHVFVRLGGVS